MMDFLKQLPHLEPYGNPVYFVYIVLAVLPIFVGLFFKKRFPLYEALVSLVFIVLMLTGPSLAQLCALLGYVIWQIVWVYSYKLYRESRDSKWIFYLHTLLAVLPLVLVKVEPAISGHQSLFGFLGISYLTFRSVGMMIEMRDGVLTEFTLWEFLRFLLFMPTFSSGPIDRFKRFNEDYLNIPKRDELLDMLEQSVKYIMLGFLYKFILAHIFGHLLLGHVKTYALYTGGFFNLGTLGVMYVFGLDLFFDFAGYSMFALAISNLMGIKSPINFDKPFLSRDLKEFWNRWHMSLSFWFRDYVYMRLMFTLIKKKVFKSRIVASNVGYFALFLLMGIWHGLTWYYILYGVYHATLICGNDAWIRWKKKQGNLPSNNLTKAVSTVLTFQAVCFSFLIFSGILDKLFVK